jgi:hypothetical protein
VVPPLALVRARRAARADLLPVGAPGRLIARLSHAVAGAVASSHVLGVARAHVDVARARRGDQVRGAGHALQVRCAVFVGVRAARGAEN